MVETRTVEFFFSPGSRYSYLAASQLFRIAARTSCHFEWRPVRGSDIRALRGRDPFDGEAVSGQYDWAYRERDAAAWASFYGIRYREPPSQELDFDLLARAAAAGQLLDRSAELGWALCAAVYGSETWPLDEEACLRCGEASGLPAAVVAGLLEGPEPGKLLSDNAREAFEREAFGVPTFFFGGEMFWGNDRLVLLEHALRRAGSRAAGPPDPRA